MPPPIDASSASLSAPYVLTYAYRRSLGPVMSGFFTGLRDRKVLGARAADGRVYAPPLEADPQTGADLSELVEVGPGGVVTTWAWVPRPRPKHPLDRPFAWALVRLDGAAGAMLHAVDAGTEGRMRTGMRVRPRWRTETVGDVHDIECFVPEEAAP